MRSNHLNHLVESNVTSSRNAVNADLIGKIVYNDASVFRRLRVADIEEEFVATCIASLKSEKTEDIELLKKLAQAAEKKSLKTLEDEEKTDKANDANKEEKSGNFGSAEELKMYQPLGRLLSHITNYNQATPPAGRIFQTTNQTVKADEPHTFGFPSASPDITICPIGVSASKSRLWRHRDAFGEVKASKKQGPNPDNGVISKIEIQSADCARLFLSDRPFMLFCVGVLIFGTEFCVGIFDRDGITFSPIFDMFEGTGTETFVRIVRSLAVQLSVEELGHDPSIGVFSDEETKRLTGLKSKHLSAVVAPIGKDLRHWCTLGPPIWTSLSLLGRGTNVWLVRVPGDANHHCQSYLRGPNMIMKTAWRISGRTPDSDIYLSIERPNPKGLAEFVCGGDVRLPGNVECPITIQNLRRNGHGLLREDQINPKSPTPILHRLILGTVGRPMWQYKSEHDLLTGFRDALQAHKTLCERGILHRDISAGNILLTETPDDGLRGFITDLEFSRIGPSTIHTRDVTIESPIGPQSRYDNRGRLLFTLEATTRTHIRFGSSVTVKRGAPMIGTTQFMARSVLLQEGDFVEPEAKHDVESFIWVLSYCVMRNLYDRASLNDAGSGVQEQCKEFRLLFAEAFSQTTPMKLANERHGLAPALIFPRHVPIKAITGKFMSNVLVTLFEDLQDLITAAYSRRGLTPLTHESLLEVIDRAIALLS